VADPEVAVDDGLAEGDGFGSGGVGGCWGSPAEGPVRAGGVVVAAEAVELVLEFGEGVGPVLAVEPVLECLMETFDFPAGLGVIRPGVAEGDAEGDEFDLEGDTAAAAGIPVNTAPLSERSWAGVPWRAVAWRKQSTTSAALNVGRASEPTARREWSSMMLRISTLVPSSSAQWVTSSCQRSLGRSASKRR
jgi:hypothetical protein